MVDDHEDFGQETLGPSPPWLHLLRPDQRAWRESQILKGRDPDSYIESQLREAGAWPEKPSENDNA